MFASLWQYKGFITNSVKRDFKARYMNSLLGAGWLVLQPLAMIAVYTVVFSSVMKMRMPNSQIPYSYGIYLCAGILPWGFFVESISRIQNVFLENSHIIKKSSLPRICFPVITQLACLINFAIIFALFLIFLISIDYFPTTTIWAFFPVFFLQILFTFGLGVWLATLNVFFRDVGSSMGVVLQFWFWATPIVYSKSLLPEKAAELLVYNPLSQFISAYQDIFLNQKTPQWDIFIYPMLLTLVLLLIGYFTFKKRSPEMIDEL